MLGLYFRDLTNSRTYDLDGWGILLPSGLGDEPYRSRTTDWTGLTAGMGAQRGFLVSTKYPSCYMTDVDINFLTIPLAGVIQFTMQPFTPLNFALPISCDILGTLQLDFEAR